MFAFSKFRGDINDWNVSRVEFMENAFKDSPLSGYRSPDWYVHRYDD